MREGVNDFQISDHFNLREFSCKGDNCCNGATAVHFPLVRGLENLRELVLKKNTSGRVQLNCGYRCPKHNAEVGGVKTSEHMQGCAADINAPATGLSVEELFHLCEQVPEFIRIGKYPTHGFVHVSSIQSSVPGAPNRWTK